MKGRFFGLCALGSSLLLSGCAYRMGTEPPGSSWGISRKTVHIALAPVRNLSLAPQAEGILTEQLHRYFLCTPGFKLVKESRADVVLEVTLESFDTHLESQQDNRPQSIKLSLKASASLRDAKSNSYLIKNLAIGAEAYSEVSETEDVYYSDPPLLARDLAEQVGRAVTHPWPLQEAQKKQSTQAPSP
ncbi:MAG: LPS assembly lipoprotein LptE [Puniceicoccales bacterium]|jgi:hypothetical protein|nr:LPS assembly lipoprotein LptE [Puniceicoccales bacterium]